MGAAGKAGASAAPIEYADASADVRAVYDDIMATRKTDWINNYWKVLAHHPPCRTVRSRSKIHSMWTCSIRRGRMARR